MKKTIISFIAFLTMTFGMLSTCSAQVQAQTVDSTSSPSESPKENSEVMQKFGAQIHNLVTAGEWWQLEKLCDEKADSIYDPFLAFGRGMVASKFLQQKEAVKLLEMCLYKYTDDMPDPWIFFAGQELVFCQGLDQEYEYAAKVSGDLLKYFSSDESQADQFQWPITYFKTMQQRNEAFAKFPKMTISCDSGEISIPFRIDSVGENKSTLMIMDGTLQSKPASMLFDTGCGYNVISQKMVDDLHLRRIDVEINMSGAAKADCYVVIADSMEVGNVMLRNVKFAVSETKLLPPGVDLVIGLPIMKLIDPFTMDFEHGVVTISSQFVDCHSKNFTIGHDELIYVRVRHNGKPIDMMIDTGNGRHNNLGYQFYTENQEEVDCYEVQRIESNGMGGSFTANYAVMKDFEFTLDDKQYSFPSINVIKDKLDVALAENNIGLRFMSRFKRVTISLKDAHIEFE